MLRSIVPVVACVFASAVHAGPNGIDERAAERAAASQRPVVKPPPPAWTTEIASKDKAPFRGVPVYEAGPRERLVLTLVHRGPTLRWSASF